ncbi:MAG: hypothetical protein A2Y33_08760 [Spirochaetes bacterium GWF1_51_8]|nr:MAG: hypothetical protein A2Y33_08760 [Spirochaetes bacterium GWF1_51_8]
MPAGVAPFTGFSREMFRFFHDLGMNNYKEWFEQHRMEYLSAVREPMRSFTMELNIRMREMDPELEEIVNPDKAIARINRDVRFSKDKSPYRTNLWITFKRSTPDWQTDPAFYFDIGFDRYSYGVGYYIFTPEMRALMKSVVRSERGVLDNAVNALSKSVFTLGGDRYKRPIDKSLSELEREWCERKSLYIYSEHEPDDVLFTRGLIDRVTNDFLTIKPVYQLFRSIKGG